MTDTVIDSSNSPSPVSMDYYRNIVVKFQSLLNTLDPVYYELQSAVSALQVSDDPDVMAAFNDGLDLLNQFETKRSELLAAGQAINYAADGLNSVGISFPKLQYQGLSVGPLVAIAGVVAAAAVLIAWGYQFIQSVSDWISRTQQLDAIQALPSDQQAQVMQAFVNAQSAIQQAKAAASVSPVTSIANGFSALIKWGAIAALGYFAFKAIEGKH